MKFAHIRQQKDLEELRRLDFKAFETLDDAETEKKPYCVCLLCYDDRAVSLYCSLVKPSYKRTGGPPYALNGNGNMTTHVQAKHAEVWEAMKALKHNYKYEEGHATGNFGDDVGRATRPRPTAVFSPSTAGTAITGILHLR
ncbi:hypothetical protein SEMRO_219_G090380.1 [Seminavis robusta]|uniref:Uncharacterized protein n=1 Tax=Seminavis robusta TaxID=568900 RepID=A0A9N8DL76_9STRA|nr:hypothetical protein SEMRO_219_G090380.1 [Seminavis robusta]|eukprot:Sro219_g090380.1 n/a (141) ;mRNA; f:31036-31458